MFSKVLTPPAGKDVRAPTTNPPEGGFVLNWGGPASGTKKLPSVITSKMAGRGLSLGLRMQYIIMIRNEQR